MKIFQWQLQQAKARLSELVRRAQTDGPQEITVHEAPAAYLVSRDDFLKLTGQGDNLADWLLASPLAGAKLRVHRDRTPPRAVDLD